MKPFYLVVAMLVVMTPVIVRASSQVTEPADSDRQALLKIRALLENGKNQEALQAANDALNQPPATEPTIAQAQSTQAAPPSANPPPYEIHGQTTVVSQRHDAFHAPFTGPHSLLRYEDTKTSLTATLFIGAHLPWDGGAIYFDPELAGGEGFSGVQGIASFPNGEIPRVGTPAPQPYIARLYYQQVFGLGGDKQEVDSDQNQLAGSEDARRITLWLGKFAASDFFDNNTYSHDPRMQFLNLSMMSDTAWDYPADARGYAEGGVIEYNEPSWALRYGIFREPREANGGRLDDHVFQAFGQAVEFEDRWSLADRPGVARFMAYGNVAHMGNYGDAISHPGPNGPDVTQSRTYSAKYGFGVSAEQAVTPDLAVWGRAGWNDGHTETWAFTEVDRLGSLGISLKGTSWNRPDDVFGFGGSIAGLSRDHRDYLRDGGLGFIIGDGRLNYAPEEVLESYYLIKVSDHVFVTPDAQFVDHPAYDSARGPVFIGAVRVHAEF